MSLRMSPVVVVDDEPKVGRAVARLLESAGFQAAVFPSAESLLETTPLAPAGCFIFDIHLPGMSGLDLAERLRETGVRSPIAFITARDEPLARERARDVGAIGFLVKPFESEPLLALLARALPQQVA